jgi:hypothetical protein
MKYTFITSCVVILTGCTNSDTFSCTSFNPDVLKNIYFAKIAHDAETLKILCLSNTSKIDACSDSDNKIIHDEWMDYRNRSIVGITKVDNEENFGKFKVCSYKAKISLAISKKEDRTPNSFDYTIPLKLKISEKSEFFGLKKTVQSTITNENWYYLNVEQPFSTDDNNREWYSAPVYATVLQFRRFLLLNKTLVNPELSKNAKDFYQNLEKKISDVENSSKEIREYLEKSRFN